MTISIATLLHSGYTSHSQKKQGDELLSWFKVSHSKLFLQLVLGGQYYGPGTDLFGVLVRNLHVDI